MRTATGFPSLVAGSNVHLLTALNACWSSSLSRLCVIFGSRTSPCGVTIMERRTVPRIFLLRALSVYFGLGMVDGFGGGNAVFAGIAQVVNGFGLLWRALRD